MTNVLHASGIAVRRGQSFTLEPCNFTLAPGETVGIYGPNGAGKSTLCQALAALIPLARGTLHFNGKQVGTELPPREYHRSIAAVFQEPHLLRGTVWYNVTLGLKLRGVSPKIQEDRARPWLERLKIAHLSMRPARTLSAGEAQRTSLARALVIDPQVLFLDEPFANLDTPTRTRLVGEIGEILAERRTATVLVTHDLDEALALTHRCHILDHGRMLQEGNLAAIIDSPASDRVAEIVASTRPGRRR